MGDVALPPPQEALGQFKIRQSILNGPHEGSPRIGLRCQPAGEGDTLRFRGPDLFGF